MKADHEARELNWKMKQLREQNGAQGRSIYNLRCIIEELRSSSSKIERGELRRLERQVPELKAELELERAMSLHQSDVIKALQDKIRSLQSDQIAEVEDLADRWQAAIEDNQVASDQEQV